jgi:hypothetical protein
MLSKSTWYYVLVSLMFIIVLVPFVLAIYEATSSTSTTGRNDKMPLGLPIGSFRSILAYSLVAYLGFYVLTSILSISTFAPSDFLLGIVATVIGFYFGSRSTDEGAASQVNGTVRGIVRQGGNPASGAMVRFKRSDKTEPYSRISDLGGRFELSGVLPGTYKVYASITGSAPSNELEISVTDGSDHEIEIIINGDAGGVHPNDDPPDGMGTVQGTVKKLDASPAQGATVTFSQGGNAKFSLETDVDGKYKKDIRVGSYKIVASLPGTASSDELDVKVAQSEQKTVNLNLK